MTLAREDKLALYKTMLRIRQVELHMESLYHLDEMKTPIHLCIGQEAIAAGVCSILRREDYIQSNHRSHGHYLAKGGDLKALIAEIYGREAGCSKGRGGSMHIVDVSVGHLGSSSIVGGGIPIGTGLGLAIRQRKEARVSAIFFGDGAADEGTLYESVNFAILERLPVIYILENNQWSVCSPVSARHWGENIFLRAPQDRLFSARIDGNDVLAVREIAASAAERARRGEGPSFIECTTYRIRGHAGSFSDAKVGYRTQAEIDAWEARCPVAQLKALLLADGVQEAALAAMAAEIDAEIREAFDFAQRSPLPRPEDVGLYLYREEQA